LLEQVVANPDIRIHELELVSGAEKEQILHAFNDTAVNSPREKTIYQLLEEQTARTPERVAVYCEGQRLTYRELNERANRLARTLRSAGVQRDRFVGLMVERSLEMVVSVFAILKAGGAYVPIDPEYPEDRIRYMLEDSGAKLLLTQEQLRERIAADLKDVTVLAADEEANYHADGSNLEPVSGADDLAYVI
ncbi:AMP-binding protein, partial [Paenibacillus tyrfis]|uniref:AMP-binding protein n=1 Tax=Paenibacillus tyrfis TaxID=1501230 RepID=UPI00209CD3A0